MITSQIYISKKACIAPGFASLLTVISTGLALMIMLLMMYEDTLQTQSVQKRNMLSSDYQQREDAFLRALVDIVPNQAMRSMTDDSWNNRAQLKWNVALSNALLRANAQQALPDNIATSLDVASLRTGNSANFTKDIKRKKVVFAVDDDYIDKRNSNPVSAGVEAFREEDDNSKDYPPFLTETGHNRYNNRSTSYPIISNSRIYDDSAAAWTGGRSTDNRFGLIQLPKNHFRYKEGDTFIAKHNWWTFKVNFSDLQKDATQHHKKTKQYLFSIYEVPAQLAINAGSEVILGKHEGSVGAWHSNLKVEGGVFASQVKTDGDFTSSSIASRKQIELSSGSVIGSGFKKTDLAGNSPESYESKAQDLLITSAGDSGRVAFIPINGGEFVASSGTHATLQDAKDAAFYDNPNLTMAVSDPDSNEPGSNSVSPTSWNYYSCGASQCKMRLVFDDGAFIFSFEDPSLDDAAFTSHPDYPNVFSQDEDLSLKINLFELLALLDKLVIPEELSNSLYIKYDGVGSRNVILTDAENLAMARKGFSIVTNSHLVVASNINNENATFTVDADTGDTVETAAPPIPFSLFAPTTQFGRYNYANKIEITGQITSTTKQGSSYIADLKAGDGIVSSDNIKATLESITDPTNLPPINMMNWMVVVREITIPE